MKKCVKRDRQTEKLSVARRPERERGERWVVSVQLLGAE